MGFNLEVVKILQDSKKLILDDRFASDAISYHHFLKFFEGKDEISENDLIVSAYFSYGWMPTILNLNFKEKSELNKAIELLNRVKNGKFLDAAELEILKKLFNNSIVGTSKLLHFISPSKYLIWDSRVGNYFGIKSPNKVELYLQYLDFCHKLNKEVVKEVYSNVVEQAPSMKDVTELRALEFVFFNKGVRLKMSKGI